MMLQDARRLELIEPIFKDRYVLTFYDKDTHEPTHWVMMSAEDRRQW